VVNRTKQWSMVLIGFGLAAGLSSVACKRKAPPEPDLRIEDHTLFYRGERLEPGMALGEWKHALGEPSRYVDRDGGIYVWDDLGLAVSLLRRFPASDPHVALLRIFFSPRSADFWPHQVYRGTIRATYRMTVSESGYGPSVQRQGTAAFHAGITHAELFDQEQANPGGTRYIQLRFAGQPADNGPLELLSFGIDPGMHALPWEGVDGGVAAPNP
jgi:hypothetical protein